MNTAKARIVWRHLTVASTPLRARADQAEGRAYHTFVRAGNASATFIDSFHAPAQNPAARFETAEWENRNRYAMPVSSRRARATVSWVFCDMIVDDLPEVVAIERASFPNPWTGSLFLQELQVDFSRTIVARDPAGAVAGYACRWLVADEVHVLNVAVNPRWRGHGLGASLMREVLREARSCRAAAVTLEVRRSNVPGRRLYESLGFEEVGSRSNYYGRGEDALILRLALSDA